MNTNNELDFTNFKVTGKRVILELPTKTSGGLIYVNDQKALDSGWFKVVAIGTEVTHCKPGEEVFVFFSNEPYHIDEIVFKSRKEQLQNVESEKFAESIKVNIGAPKDNIFKLPPVERKFCEVGEYDIHFVRDWKDESVKKS